MELQLALVVELALPVLQPVGDDVGVGRDLRTAHLHVVLEARLDLNRAWILPFFQKRKHHLHCSVAEEGKLTWVPDVDLESI